MNSYNIHDIHGHVRIIIYKECIWNRIFYEYCHVATAKDKTYLPNHDVILYIPIVLCIGIYIIQEILGFEHN